MPRHKRPLVDRDGPIRNWASAMNAAPPAPTPDAGVNHSDPVVRGVVFGNRVVEDWMRQAQHTARLLGDSTAGSGWTDASGRMLKTASDVMAAWWWMLGVTPPGAAPGVNGNGSAGPSPPPFTTTTEHDGVATARERATAPGERTDPERAAASPLLVTVDVKSRQAVSVTVDVRQIGVADVQVLDLRPERGKARRIRGTTATVSAAEGLRLRLAVPDDQPPGTYHAVIVDRAQDRAVGTITVRVLAE